MLYYPSNLEPNNTSIDASLSNTFSWVYNGDGTEILQTKYKVDIYGLDNTLKYSTGEVVSGTPSVVVPSTPTIVNGQKYKWQVTLWSGVSTIKSQFYLFKTVETNHTVLENLPNPFAHQFYTFKMNYDFNNNTKLKYYQYILYDVNDNILFDTGYITPSDITSSGNPFEYEITGLSNGVTYKIEGICINQEEVVSKTVKTQFTPQYTTVDQDVELLISQDLDLGMNVLNWSGIFQIIGVVTPSNGYSLTTGRFDDGIKLNNGAELRYSTSFQNGYLQEDIPEDFQLTFYVKLPSTFSGEIVKLVNNENNNFIFGYDGVTQRFYFKSLERNVAGRIRDLSTMPNWILIGINADGIIIEYENDIEIIQ